MTIIFLEKVGFFSAGNLGKILGGHSRKNQEEWKWKMKEREREERGGEVSNIFEGNESR